MEHIIKQCNKLYDDLEAAKKDVAGVALLQAAEAKRLSEKESALKQLADELKLKSEGLKVYENIAACEKANKTAALNLASDRDNLEKEIAKLANEKKEWAKFVFGEQVEIKRLKEQYEAEVVAVKKTQAELKAKQEKVDKFLAQVKG